MPTPASAQGLDDVDCVIVPDLPECDDEEDTGDEIPNTPVMPVAPFTPPLVDPRGVDPRSPNPLNGLGWYVDKSRWVPQWRQYRHFQRSGQRGKAAMLGKIALQPQFRWFGRWNEDEQGGIAGVMRRYLQRVQREQPGTVPQIVTLRHQGKECHSRYKAGGAAEDARTRRWFRSFARGVGTARVVIGFEPDSVGTINCLARSRRKARMDVLRYGIDVLSQLPNATIYIEASASDWTNHRVVAKRLRYIGVAKVRGFMLNVTHYDWTGRNIRYGRKISRLVGGKHFIVSTSFNGRGPVHYRRWINRKKYKWRRITVWCHPLRRGLGIAPTTQTGDGLADAFLYVGRPGYSGGDCNGGPLPIGSWYSDRALMFARFATGWTGPPRGFRYGWPRGLSLRAVAGDQLQR
ncbi:MAG TPA: glycoside hydrolase family 6 protein [Thermoleophilaceae bacterium]|nr:glycoside hydrolase family 6 protein [Thermoleophilaceae bacterium]